MTEKHQKDYLLWERYEESQARPSALPWPSPMGEEWFRRIIEEILESTAVEANCTGGTQEKDDARTI